jgi:hypothetical protein
VLLSSLSETADAALFGAVFDGYVLDDGGPVESEVLAFALELWRMTGDLSRVRAGLEGWRPGEPWEEWIEAAVEGWREVRPHVEHCCRLVDALALCGEAMRAEAAAHAGLERALKRHALAREAGERAARMMREVTRGR